MKAEEWYKKNYPDYDYSKWDIAWDEIFELMEEYAAMIFSEKVDETYQASQPPEQSTVTEDIGDEYWNLVCTASDYLHKGCKNLASNYMDRANKIRQDSQQRQEVGVSEIENVVKHFEMVNPKLISDGHGEYPDTYVMGNEDAVELSANILELLNQKK